MAAIPQVGPQDILPEGSGRVALSPLQRIGAMGTILVGCVATAVTLFLLARWAWIAPSMPVIGSTVDSATASAMIQNYRSLSDVAREDTLKIFDSFVIKLLLPIFTSFLGYVFGSHAKRES